jgi:hypothetical protein
MREHAERRQLEPEERGLRRVDIHRDDAARSVQQQVEHVVAGARDGQHVGAARGP